MTKTVFGVVLLAASGILGAGTATVSATCTVNDVASPTMLAPGDASCTVTINDRTALSAEATAQPFHVTAVQNRHE
jgi:hypothetical protein